MHAHSSDPFFKYLVTDQTTCYYHLMKTAVCHDANLKLNQIWSQYTVKVSMVEILSSQYGFSKDTVETGRALLKTADR